MFEKEAGEYATVGWDKSQDPRDIFTPRIDETKFNDWRNGAEFGYNKAKEEVEEKYKETLCNSELNLASVTEQLEELEKANEWHYVKDEGTPIHRGHYLVCLRDKCHSILDCWISFDKDIGWYSLQVRLVDIYAWKEIVLPELPIICLSV